MSFWTELSDTSFKVDWVNANGIRTRYLEAGQGDTTVLLLHGMAGHLDTFLRNVAVQARHYRVLAMDMLGHGYSSKPDHDYEIRHYVEHVLAFLDVMGVRKLFLAGTSLGGWTGARIAATHPGRIQKLALVSPGGLTSFPAVMNSIKTLSTQAVLENSHESVRRRLEWVIHDPKKVDEEIIDTRLRIYSQADYKASIGHVMCLQEMTVRARNMLSDEELSRINAPTLVIWTDHDPTADLSVGRRFADAIPNSQFRVFKDSGHMPQFEEPEIFNETILNFWQST